MDYILATDWINNAYPEMETNKNKEQKEEDEDVKIDIDDDVDNKKVSNLIKNITILFKKIVGRASRLAYHL